MVSDPISRGDKWCLTLFPYDSAVIRRQAMRNVNPRHQSRLLRNPRRAVSRGFTLIEMAVVVVIVITLMSLGLGVLNSQLTSAAHAETKKRQAVIKEALVAYLGAHKRLPCPDVPNNTNGAGDTSQVTGLEDRAGGVPTGACSSTLGVVPYATLGLSRELALDGWGNFMSYSLPTGSTTKCPAGGDWSLSTCFGAAKDSPYEVVEGTVSASTSVATNVLAVVVSHGPNGFAAWASQGTRNVLPSRCEEAHNAIASIADCTLTDNRFYRGERSGIDDVLAYVTRDEAINTLAVQGTLKSAEAQVAEDLRQLGSAWTDELLDDCSGSPPAMKDPWGNDYIATSGAWPYTICSTRGGSPATPACVYIYETDMSKLGAPC